MAATVRTKALDVSRIAIELLCCRCHTLVEDSDVLFKLSSGIPRHLGGKQIIGGDLPGVRQEKNESCKARPKQRRQEWTRDRCKPGKVIPEPRKTGGNT